MAKADSSIDPRILASAKSEFLDKGFKNASLKDICSKANVTTGALYKRYTGKEELFCAVVKETLDDLENFVKEKSKESIQDFTDDKLIKDWDMDEDYMMWWFRFLYDRYDGFILLIKFAEGTCYSNFQHDWVANMTDATYEHYKEAYNRGLTKRVISKPELHILLSAFWATIYEPFIHNYSWEQIKDHCELVCRLFNWHNVFGFKKQN